VTRIWASDWPLFAAATAVVVADLEVGGDLREGRELRDAAPRTSAVESRSRLPEENMDGCVSRHPGERELLPNESPKVRSARPATL
jgi:hypothetical protein